MLFQTLPKDASSARGLGEEGYLFFLFSFSTGLHGCMIPGEGQDLK